MARRLLTLLFRTMFPTASSGGSFVLALAADIERTSIQCSGTNSLLECHRQVDHADRIDLRHEDRVCLLRVFFRGIARDEESARSSVR